MIRCQKRNCIPLDGDSIILLVADDPYDDDDTLARLKKPRTIIGSRTDIAFVVINTNEEGSKVIVACPSSSSMILFSPFRIIVVVAVVSRGRNIISRIESKSDD